MTDLGFGLLDSRDSGRFLDALRPDGPGKLQPGDLEAGLRDAGLSAMVHGAPLGLAGQALLGRLHAAQMPDRFGFVRSPKLD
jgi:hypothetical protein